MGTGANDSLRKGASPRFCGLDCCEPLNQNTLLVVGEECEKD